jgi:DNA polymerase II large subunit
MQASPLMKKYFESIQTEVQRTYKIAQKARKKGLDTTTEVSIPIAINMAQRVVGLISVVNTDISNHDIPGRIAELEKKFGQLDWRVGLTIAEEVAKEKYMKFKDKKEAIEIGIRVGFAYLTLGIVSAPLEGFIGITIKKRRDGKEYMAIKFAGPIRGAGGTAASTCVILSDYVRVKMGYGTWDPDEKEINRYVTDICDYHDRVTNLQYRPSVEEIRFMVSHLPIEVDGDPTEKIEVSNYKDLDRIETNLIRGGVALVIAEGLCQKAPKLWKRLGKWGKEMDLEWDWLAEFLDLKAKIHASHAAPGKDGDKEQVKKVQPNNTFIMDLVAGRPILTHPLRAGGFRLRYGRNRTTGFSASAVNAATLIVLEKYIAIGTQLKVERPGKACTITICDTLEGPIVLLKDGSVMQLKTEDEAKQYVKKVEQVIFLGDILFNYGDFSENGHSLVPAGYCPEWWALEVKKALQNLYSDNIYQKGSELCEIEINRLTEIIENPLFITPQWFELQKICNKLQVPLHPEYIFYWSLISGEQLLTLKEWFRQGKIKNDEKGVEKIILPYYQTEELHQKAKTILNHLGVPHQVINKENIVIERKEATIFASSFTFIDQKGLENIKLDKKLVANKNGLEVINFLSEFTHRDKAGTFIGARMGRPEKAKQRHLQGSPQVMFPVGEEGGRLRSFQSAIKAGKVRSAFPLFFCEECKLEMIYKHCEECGKECQQKYFCRFCGDLDIDTCRHGPANTFKIKDINIKVYFEQAQKRIGEKIIPDLIKGVRGTSNKDHVIEHLSKGILRAKHRIYVNKEGTTRYDCTELPLTHFKPKEISAPVERLKELGYTHDIHGIELTEANQLLEIKPQDIILPGFNSLEESGPKVLSRVANYVDDLLKKFYKMKTFYNIKKEEDLIGHLVIGLAPHISAGMVGRIIGYSETQGLLTHPMFHAGMRRDCVHPNIKFIYSHNNKINYVKIGSFVENLIKNKNKTEQIDDFGTIKINLDKKYFVFGLHPNTKKLIRKRVKYFIKAPIPKQWVKIKTVSGRSFVMTETHDFMFLHNTNLKIKKAKLAKIGDKIPLLNLQNIDNIDKQKLYDLTYKKELFNHKYYELNKINDMLIDEVNKVEFFKENVNSYCLEIEHTSDADKNILWGEQIINSRCDGDEAAVMLLMDAFLNFSRNFLPKSRGSTMDAPLVLTSFLDPAEVDDQVHGMDIVWQYPLELYEAALEMKNPWDVKVDGKKIEQLGDRLGTPGQYENMGFTHHVDNFNRGIQCSAYKTIPSMAEKLVGQMEIARKVRAVDLGDVAKLVIQKHFLKDIKGNLRKFSMQQFRCVKCNAKYRRPPLTSKCTECQGKLIFTISHGSVIKYLGPSLMLCDKYEFSPYLKQTLAMLQSQVDLIFGKEKDKQVGLGDWVKA